MNIAVKTAPEETVGEKSMGLHINYPEMTVTNDGRKIDLSALEFKLLYFLATNKNRVYNRDQILTHVWDPDVIVTDRSVDIVVMKVRKKLWGINNPMKQGLECKYIQTIKGKGGYKFIGDISSLERKPSDISGIAVSSLQNNSLPKVNAGTAYASNDNKTMATVLNVGVDERGKSIVIYIESNSPVWKTMKVEKFLDLHRIVAR